MKHREMQPTQQLTRYDVLLSIAQERSLSRAEWAELQSYIAPELKIRPVTEALGFGLSPAIASRKGKQNGSTRGSL